MSCSSRAIRARSSLTAVRAFCSPSRSSTTVRSASLAARDPWLRTARPATHTLTFMTAMKKKLPNSPSTTASSTKAGTSTTAAPTSAPLSSQCAATEYIASTTAAIPKTVTSGVFDTSAKTVSAAITTAATATGARRRQASDSVITSAAKATSGRGPSGSPTIQTSTWARQASSTASAASALGPRSGSREKPRATGPT